MEIGNGEVLMRAFAEANGLEAKAEFRYPAKGKKGIQVDPVKPARLVSRTGRKLDSRSKTFEALKQAAEKSVEFENVALTVGQGAQAVQVIVGEIKVNAAFIEAILKTVLEKFTPDTPVTMTFRKAHFTSGHDLKDFADKLGFDLQPGDVESMSEQLKFVGFGAPDKFGAHLFRVEIPASRNEPVRIIEDYGYRGLEGGIPRDEDRVILTRSDLVRHRRHRPPRVQRPPQSRQDSRRGWHTGTNLVDRLLGKELCALAWAAETANDDQLPVICSKWAALRPEERWWLFSMTVAEAGLPEDTQRGWRRALFLALSDGEKPAQGRKRRRPVESDLFSLPLFKAST